MNQELIQILSRITEEEQRILNVKKEVQKERYTSSKDFVIQKNKMLEEEQLITIRPHTRFIDFPRHKHDYIEVVYVCRGTLTHIINDVPVVLEEGDLLFLNQHTYHAIKEASKEDIAINLIILPRFFDVSFTMIQKDNVLADFLVGILRNASHKEQYLHFKVKGILEIENLLENLVYSLVHDTSDNDMINQRVMGLLFLYLVKYSDSLKAGSPNSYEDVIAKAAVNYIEINYQTASLTELAEKLCLSLSTISRLIASKTGKSFRALLKEKRFQVAMSLLAETNLSVTDIVTAVGYENNSFFHRKFREQYHMSPKEYREKNRRTL